MIKLKQREIGELKDVYSYCNEKDYKGGFLFKCNSKCRHNKK